MTEWREFRGLQAIADYYGISLSSLKKKHVKEMLETQVILAREIRPEGRPRHTEYFAWENRLQMYAVVLARKGFSL